MEFKYWVLCGVVIVCYGFIKWIGAFISNKVISKIEEIINAINTLTNTIVQHTERLKTGDELLANHTQKLEEHSKEITNIKLGCKKC